MIAFGGDVQDKVYFGYVLDAQMSSWIYGFMLASSGDWIARRIGA